MEQFPQASKEFSFLEKDLTNEVLEKDNEIHLRAIENVEEALKQINFSVLGSIFSDLLKKTFIDKPIEEITRKVEKALNVPRRVGFVDIENATAYTDGVKQMYFAKDLCDSEGNVDFPLVVNVVLHETLHDLSLEENIMGEKIQKLAVGVARTSDSAGEDGVPLFNDINEGLTEIIKDAIFSEYIARTGDVNDFKEAEELWLKSSFIERSPAYINERLAVHTFIAKIGALSGISEEEIFRALVVEYMRSGNLSRSEMMDAFKEYPIILNYIKKFENNIINPLLYGLPSDAESEMLRELQFQESDYIKALFGRDRVGENNMATVENRMRELSKDRYTGLI